MTKIQGLIVFQGKLARQELEKSTSIAVDEVDQENKIKLHYEIAPFGAFIKYSILFINESNASITEIKVRIKYPEFLELTRHYPSEIGISVPKVEKGVCHVSVGLDKLIENSKTQINFYFAPLTSGIKDIISTSTSYINNKDMIGVINPEPIELLIPVITLEPKIIPSFKVGEFLKLEGIKKAIRSFGIGIKGKPFIDLYFDQINDLLKKNNLQLITKVDDKKIAWYFGTELESREDILVIGQIVSNKVEFLAASNNQSIIVSLLAVLSNDFKKRFSNMAMVPIDQIYNLECKFCGNILPTFPAKGLLIECQKCHKEQLIW